MARLFYNEPYRAAAMLSKTVTDQETIKVEHELRFGQTRNRLRITGSAHREKPSTESVEHFFKEHSWGFGKSRRGGLLQYRVMHPEWEIYPVRSWNLDWDFCRGVRRAVGDSTISRTLLGDICGRLGRTGISKGITL